MGQQINVLVVSLADSQNLFQKNMEEMLLNFQKEIEKMITNRGKGPNAPSHPDNTAGGSNHTGENHSSDAADIIQEALIFANNETSKTCNVSNLVI